MTSRITKCAYCPRSVRTGAECRRGMCLRCWNRLLTVRARLEKDRTERVLTIDERAAFQAMRASRYQSPEVRNFFEDEEAPTIEAGRPLPF